MNTQDTTIPILEDALQRADSIDIPKYLEDFYDQHPVEKELDEMKGFNSILDRAKNLAKPAICLLGPYSSGKTFLLNYLTQDATFISKIDPTTAVITIIRHLEDKPKSWPIDSNVFTLKKNVDLRTLDYRSVTGNYTLDDLPCLTTYPEATQHDAVIVFIEKEILKQCIFYDCPGVGTMSEAENAEISIDNFTLKGDQKKVIREQELQRLAIVNADAHIILSTVIGNSGCFSDQNFGNILYALAHNMTRFPTAFTHGNLLFVGSRADPSKGDLYDEEHVLRILQNAIQSQVENLPQAERLKFDVVELKKRIVLFYSLDRREIEIQTDSIKRTLSRLMQTSNPLEIQRAAEAEFSEQREAMERTAAFNAAIQTINEQLLLGIQDFRAQITKNALSDAIQHYLTKQNAYLARVTNQKYFEDLARRYESERDNREKNWQEIGNQFDKDIDEAKDRVLKEIKKILLYWSSKDNVYRFLEEKYGDNKQQAKEYSAFAIQDQINEEFEIALHHESAMPQQRLDEKLRSFDAKWLDRNTTDPGIKEQGEISQFVNSDSLHVPNIEAVSMAGTFGALSAAVAGGTTLLAVGGSSLAQAALFKVLAIGVGTLGSVGLGYSAAGLIVGIPVYGWIAGGLAGVGIAIWKFFAWRESMAKTISKSMEKNRESAIKSATFNINDVFMTMRHIGQENLENTKAILDAHISQVNEIGKGHVSSRDLGQAAEFYSQHAKLLQQTSNKIEFEQSEA